MGTVSQKHLIDTSEDDVHVVVGGDWDIIYPDIQIGRSATSKFEPVWRWSVQIPKYATITGAKIQFTSLETSSSVANVRIHLLDYDNANSINWVTDPRTIPLNLTPITQDWTPASWTVDNQRDVATLTPNIDHLVQSFIDRAGYARGKYIGVMITSLDSSGDLSRTIESGTAQLNVTFTTPTSSALNDVDGRSTRIEIDAASTVKVTHWQIFDEAQPVSASSTSATPYPVKISSSHTKPSNVTSMDTSHISVWYPPGQNFKIRYRFDKDNTWSEFIHFTSIGYLTSYDRGRILSGLI